MGQSTGKGRRDKVKGRKEKCIGKIRKGKLEEYEGGIGNLTHFFW
jgi:hypothetical protein